MKAIVVGASSGIGAELVAQLVDLGYTVAAVARREERLRAMAERWPGKVIFFQHDVTRSDEIPELFQQITQRLGGLDLFIFTAGVMPDVEAFEFSTEKDFAMIDTNLKGAIAWTNPVAERFLAVRHGTIIGIGSVAGDRGRSGKPGYAASKAGLATYLEAVRNRLAGSGVNVVTIKPGPVATDMTVSHKLKNPMSAEAAARLILNQRNKNGERYLSVAHRLIFAAIRLTPGWLFRRIGPP